MTGKRLMKDDVFGLPVTEPRDDVGIVFQDHLLLEFRTAMANVMLQQEIRRLGDGASSKSGPATATGAAAGSRISAPTLPLRLSLWDAL